MDGRVLMSEDPEEFCADFILAPKLRPDEKKRDDYVTTHFEYGGNYFLFF